MEKKYFNLRLSDRRLNKLRIYAVTHDKTMTHVIEELIDGLPLESLGDWSTYVKIAIHLSADPVGYSVIAKRYEVPLLAG